MNEYQSLTGNVLGKDLYKINVKPIPGLHRCVSITCDPAGKNFCAIQVHPKTFLLDLPQVNQESDKLKDDMREFYKFIDMGDTHDVVLMVSQVTCTYFCNISYFICF